MTILAVAVLPTYHSHATSTTDTHTHAHTYIYTHTGIYILFSSVCSPPPSFFPQGARLTAFEIVQDGLPGTLIADSMASALMAVKGVDCVVVGADRVAANG